MSEARIPDVEWHSVKVFTDGVVCTGFELSEAKHFTMRAVVF